MLPHAIPKQNLPWQVLFARSDAASMGRQTIFSLETARGRWANGDGVAGQSWTTQASASVCSRTHMITPLAAWILSNLAEVSVFAAAAAALGIGILGLR